MRLYGHATVTPIAESPLAERLLATPAENIALPERQAIVVDVESTVTSCGYGVPVMTFGAQRTVRERGRRYKMPRKA